LHYKQAKWQGGQDCDRLQKAELDCTIRGADRFLPISSVRCINPEQCKISLVEFAKNFLKKSFENPKVSKIGADNDPDTR
jgi:hypothetical protein